MEEHISAKIAMKRAYQVCVASIADSMDVSFNQSPYETHADFFTAAVSKVEQLTVMTCEDRLDYNENIDGCTAETVGSWLASQPH